ncbi:Fic family protein [Candidatus Gottesmanbacteria bacterium]|nr:Fic family protein [Candidatus Gottesmanbacteria bacterium]
MKFPPIFTINPSIKQCLYDLDVLKAALLLHPIPESKAKFLREASILKSSLYSARIEGNPLTLADVGQLEAGVVNSDKHLQEVFNLSTIYSSLDRFAVQPFTLDCIREIHKVVMNGLISPSGLFRVEESAIFNSAGIAVYLPPAPRDVLGLLEGLIQWMLTTKDPIPVVAAVFHIWFEKIHPFEDGNGRVGRVVSAIILRHGEYGFGGLVPFEEYLDHHRQDYYDALGKDRQDVSDFIEFYLHTLVSQVRSSLHAVDEPLPVRHTSLSPRRAEIVEIVNEHALASFDFLSRRFRAVPTRTLHYDLSELIKSGYIRRLGTTRGALYAPGEKA